MGASEVSIFSQYVDLWYLSQGYTISLTRGMLMERKTKKIRLCAWFSLLFLLFFWACALGPSHFRRSYDVSNTFEDFKLISQYQYYYNGLSSSPDAVVGIKPGYTLNSPHWHVVDLDAKRLRQMVEGMLNNPGSEYNTEPNGAYISNDKGDVVGIWYSVWKLPLATFTSDNEFSISQPVADFPRSNKDPEERKLWPLHRVN